MGSYLKWGPCINNDCAAEASQYRREVLHSIALKLSYCIGLNCSRGVAEEQRGITSRYWLYAVTNDRSMETANENMGSDPTGCYLSNITHSYYLISSST